MLEVEYVLKRDETDKIEVYTRAKAIPRKIDNITFIAGPNSMGKSAFLNIIALAFYGNVAKTDIIPELYNQINQLAMAIRNKLEFNVDLSNKDDTLLLKSKKNAENSTVEVWERIGDEKEHRLTPDAFTRKYYLLYDIPNDIITRLDKITDSIKKQQDSIGNRLAQFQAKVREIAIAIRESRDPAKIDEKASELKRTEKDLEKVRQSKDTQQDELSILAKYVAARFKKYYDERTAELTKKIVLLLEKEKKSERKAHTENKKYTQSRSMTDAQIMSLQNKYDAISSLLSVVFVRDQLHLEQWRALNLRETMNEFSFPPQLENLIAYFIRETRKKKEVLDKADVTKEIELINGLIQFLENYQHWTAISVPGTEKKIGEFLEELNERRRAHSKELNEYQNVKILFERLEEFDKQSHVIEQEFLVPLKRLKMTLPITETMADQNEIDENELDTLRTILRTVADKLKKYETLFKEVDEPDLTQLQKQHQQIIQNFQTQTEEQTLDYKKELEAAFIKSEKDEAILSYRQERAKSELARLEARKPHPFQNKLHAIEELDNRLQIMTQKFRVVFPEYLSDLNNKKISAHQSEEQKNYNEAVALFLGKVIETVLHPNGKQYTVTSINRAEETINTEEGKVIQFSDMGTGQRHSVSLIARLNAAALSGKRIIALIDETATMDDKSIKPVMNKLKELYDNDQLLLGLIVQKGDNQAKVESLV